MSFCRTMVSVGLALAVFHTLDGAASPQTSPQPNGRVDNVRFELAPGNVVHVFYDLTSDIADATFTVVLDVSLDGGETFAVRAASTSGDVGPSVAPGSTRRIVWDAAKDVETVQASRLRIRVRLENAIVRAAPVAPPARGSLTITTEPSGATVTIDGRPSGQTPLTIADLPVGSHQVTLAKAGYLENRATVEIREGSSQQLERTLTAAPAAPGPKEQSTGGGRPKWLIPVLAGAGAAAAVGAKVAGGSSTGTPATPPTTVSPPTASITVSPQGTAIMGITQVTFTAGSSAQSSFSWNFGDGATGSGATSTHIYNREGTFSVVLTATNAAGSATATSSITVRGVAGMWRPDFLNAFCFAIQMLHSGSSVGATVANGSASITVSIQSPRDITVTTPAQFGCGPLQTRNGTFDATLDTFTALIGANNTQTDTWRRQ